MVELNEIWWLEVGLSMIRVWAPLELDLIFVGGKAEDLPLTVSTIKLDQAILHSNQVSFGLN